MPVTTVGRQFADRALALVGDHLHPVVGRGEHPFDFGQRHVLGQLDRQGLAVAAHRADADADAIDGNRLVPCEAEDLVRLGLPLPFFLALAVAQILVDPRDQAAGERDAEVLGRIGGAAERLGDAAVDLQNGRGRIGELLPHAAAGRGHLGEQLAHVLGPCPAGRLIGHARQPLDETRLEEAVEPHQHQADRAVAADEVLDAAGQRVLDDVQVHGVEDDDRVVLHPQGAGRVDPIALPAGGTKLRIDLVRVVATLAGDDDVHALQGIDALGIEQLAGFLAADLRPGTAGSRRREKHRLDMGKITLGLHPVHEDRADHPPPPDQTNALHGTNPS